MTSFRETGIRYDDLGRRWTVDKLDALLSQPDVRKDVEIAHEFGLGVSRVYCIERVRLWARNRGRSEVAIALLILLIGRFMRQRDEGCAP